MIMLIKTAGIERTAEEYKAILESEGFGNFQFEPIEASSQFDVIVAHKKSFTHATDITVM